MRQDDRRCAAPDSVAEAIGQAYGGLGLAALVDQRRVDEPTAAVEQHHTQLLLGEVSHLRAEVSGYVGRPHKGLVTRRWCEAIGLTPPGKHGQQSTVVAQCARQRHLAALAWRRAHAI